MRPVLFLLVLAAGCQKSDTGPAPPAAGTGSAPARSLIDSDKPEFAAMVEALKANPADPKYKGQLLVIDLAVEEVRAEKDDKYQVTGAAGGVTVRVTFLNPPGLRGNEAARTLAPGDRVAFYGELGRFEAGAGRPVLTVFSGSISRASRPAKQ